jgi:hypothetical protein
LSQILRREVQDWVAFVERDKQNLEAAVKVVQDVDEKIEQLQLWGLSEHDFERAHSAGKRRASKCDPAPVFACSCSEWCLRSATCVL